MHVFLHSIRTDYVALDSNLNFLIYHTSQRFITISVTMLTFAFFFFSILLSFPITSRSTTSLPIPPGPYDVGISIHEIIQNRTDPFAPCCNQPRRNMISIFHPTSCSQTTPFLYMPPATAAFEDNYLNHTVGLNIANGSMESLRLQTCPPPASVNDSLPVLIFSPGAGVTRLYYSSMLQWIASTGVTVVSIDHPYDADIVEFPDGTIIYGAPWAVSTTNDQLFSMIDIVLTVRIDDVSSVIDYIGREKVGIFGHSLGAVTAVNAILTDTRIAGALYMDGVMLGPSLTTPDTKPVVLMAQDVLTQNLSAAEPLLPNSTFLKVWEELKGPKLVIDVHGARHYTFTDWPVFVQVLNISIPENASILTSTLNGIGLIDGLRVLEILRAYVSAIFDFVLKGQHEPILLGPNISFPEVSIVNSSDWH